MLGVNIQAAALVLLHFLLNPFPSFSQCWKSSPFASCTKYVTESAGECFCHKFGFLLTAYKMNHTAMTSRFMVQAAPAWQMWCQRRSCHWDSWHSSFGLFESSAEPMIHRQCFVVMFQPDALGSGKVPHLGAWSCLCPGQLCMSKTCRTQGIVHEMWSMIPPHNAFKSNAFFILMVALLCYACPATKILRHR